MYYLVVNQKLNTSFAKRHIISVANKKGFADLIDEFPGGMPSRVIMDKDEFDIILKSGYPTKENSINDEAMVEAIEDFVGPFFQKEYAVVDENELKSLYETICNEKECVS